MVDLTAAGEAFRNVLAWICLRGAVVLFAALALWRIGKVAGAPISDSWRKLTAAGRAVVCAMLLVGVIYGGGKTNNVPPNMNQPLPQMQQGGGSFLTGFTGLTGLAGAGNLVNLVNPVQTTSEDIARGYRVESVATNAAPFAAMPSNAVEYAVWSRRGGRETWFPLGLGDFVLPLGTNRVSRLRVLSGGMVETFPALNGPGSVCAAREAASLVPGVSWFWSADAEGGAKVLRWDGVFAERDGTGEYTAEMRFFPNGDFTTRSNEVETVCRRVNPDDWDGDGIANDIDLSPLVCDGEFFGPSNILPEGANTNAYCSVSLVTTGPDALIAFEGDGPSNYPDPYFVAKSGATNEVVILIGKTYVISSDWPFTIVGMSDPETEVWTVRGAAHQTSVCRPVTITSSGGHPFTMSVAPANLGGVFAWQPTMCSCSLSGSGTTFSWNCPTDCTCCGCAAEGLYSYEGYGLPATSCLCGCHYDGTGPTWELSPAPLAASVSATFTKSAVIFEAPYENQPGQWVARRSTRTRLNVVANGGPNGAALSVNSTNLLKLVHVSGPNLPLATVNVPADMQVSYSIVYEGLDSSDEADDIVIRASIQENDSENAFTNECSMTSVRLELSAVYEAPENSCTNRHIYGVGEKVNCMHEPIASLVEWSCDKMAGYGNRFVATAGMSSQCDGEFELAYFSELSPTMTVTCGDATYRTELVIVEPHAIFVPESRLAYQPLTLPGEAGGMEMDLWQYVRPNYVSFRGIDLSEVPCTNAVPPSGYFANPSNVTYLVHSVEAGAGRWNHVKTNNYWTIDSVHIGKKLPPWSAGVLTWKIPIGWRPALSDPETSWPTGVGPIEDFRFGRAIIGDSEDVYHQVFVIGDDGTTSISKFGWTVIRGTNGVVRIERNQ